MIPPGNLEALRGFIVSTLQQCADFNTALAGYAALTTFIGGIPANGPVIGTGGVPESCIMGRIPGLLASTLQEEVSKVGLLVSVDFSRLEIGDSQIAKVLFEPAHILVRVYEKPDVNQSAPAGTGMSILFMVERIYANLKYLSVPQSIMNGDAGYTILTRETPRRSANDADATLGFDVWDCPFICDVTTPIRANP